MCKQRLTNKDVKKKGFPKELDRTNIWYAPKRKKPTDDHWTVYLNDKNIKKHSWIEIGKERNINDAIPLSKTTAENHYLEHYNPKNNQRKKITKEKKLTPFLVGDVMDFYKTEYEKKKKLQVEAGEKLKSTVKRNITTKKSNIEKVKDFFGDMDLRNIKEDDFYEFIKKRGVGKSTIGNNLSTFSTALNFKLERLANETTSRTIKPLKEELKRVITIIRYFRRDNKLTVNAALKRAKEPRLNGHGRIPYPQFKAIIQWMRENPDIENAYVNFIIFEFFAGERYGAGSNLQGKHIIIKDDDIMLLIPSILTKDNSSGLYSVHPEIETILRKRLKENIKDDEYIFTITNYKNGKKQKISRYFYDNVWRAVKIKFNLRLANGKYQTPHILRHSAVNNLREAGNINIQNQTRQSKAIIKHYTQSETINGMEIARLIAWQEDEEKKLKEKEDKEIGKKGVKTFFHSDKQKDFSDTSNFSL